MTTVEKKLDEIAEEVAMELKVEPEDLALNFQQENQAQVVTILVEKMDKICALMDYQAEIIERSKSRLEDAKYLYKTAEKDYKHKKTSAYLDYKQGDRIKYGSDFKKLGCTDAEYVAMADLEADTTLNFALQKERDYLSSQHNLEDCKHKYETLNNHFLSYRKSCDLLRMEIERFGTGTKHQYPSSQQRTYP